jgi:Zn-dependent protease
MQTPITLLVLLFSVVIHECAHGWTAERCGDGTAREEGRLTLNPLRHIDPVGTILVPLILALLPGGMVFGWAKPVPVNPWRLRDMRRDQALVAAAGPVSNLLLAAVCALLQGLLAGLAGLPTGPLGGGLFADLKLFLFQLLGAGIYLNVLLALFNLIPLPPLDGSWIVLRWLRGEAAVAYDRLRPFGFFIVLILMNVGLGGALNRVVMVVAGRYIDLANFVLRLVRSF